MQLGEIKIAKNSRKFSNFHGTYYEKKSPILFRYTVRPPICGFFPFQKFVHKSGFVKKIEFCPQIGFCQQIGLCPQIGWKSTNRVGEGFCSYYIIVCRDRAKVLNPKPNIKPNPNLNPDPKPNSYPKPYPKPNFKPNPKPNPNPEVFPQSAWIKVNHNCTWWQLA